MPVTEPPPQALQLAAHLTAMPMDLRQLPLRLSPRNTRKNDNNERRTYAALLRACGQPLSTPQPLETREHYAQRQLLTYFEGLEQPLRFHFEYGDALTAELSNPYEHDLGHHEELDPQSFNVIVSAFSSDTISAHALMNDPELPRGLGTSLLKWLTEACRPTLPLMFIQEALALAETTWWLGEIDLMQEEWHYLASQALGVEEEKLTPGEIESYIREEGLITPEVLNERIGLQHLRHFKRPLSLKSARRKLASIKDPRRQDEVRQLLDLTEQLTALGQEMSTLRGPDSEQIMHLAQAYHPNYAYVLDPQSWAVIQQQYGTFQEIINEHEEERSQSGLSLEPNFAMRLTPDQVPRFLRATQLLSQAADHIDQAITLIANWHEHPHRP